MNEASWIAVALSAVALIKSVASDVNARKIAKDKMEFERQVAKDKLEFDTRVTELTHKVSETEADLVDCRRQHHESETDRQVLRDKVADLERRVAMIQGGGK